jgi:hypothetical protein
LATEIRLPFPHPGQQTVRLLARRFNWLAAGRRWRKTTLAMTIAVEGAAGGETILWGAPTYDQVRIGWNETKHATMGLALFNQSVMSCTFPSGGAILYRSLDDPDNARGHTANGIVIDESGDVMASAWQEVLRPMLMDTGGWAWGIGTPKGRNWFWQQIVTAAETADSASWIAPTVGCRIGGGCLIREHHELENPDISFAEIEHLYRSLPERVFRQEILAEFIESSGGVFRCVTESIDRGRIQPEPRRQVGSYALGVDLARLEDFTVLCVLDNTGRQVYFERFNQISWERQIAAVKAVADRYGAAVIVDATGVGDPIVERLGNAGLRVEPYTMTAASKKALIDDLAMGLEQGRFRLLDVPEQTNELLAYQYELTPSRNLRMGAPEGMHDDCVIALALAAYGSATAGQFCGAY